MSAPPIVSLRGLGFAHPGDAAGRPVLAGLDLDLPRGGFTAIVGPSGVGKSTLLRVIAGLAAPGAGSVTLRTRSTINESIGGVERVQSFRFARHLYRRAVALICRRCLNARAAADRRAVSLVFQDARLMPWRRVAGNVAFGLEGLRLDASTRRARVAAALAQVGLEAQARRFPGQLSGGQRQRVGLARALAVRPDLLLMDEPFSALDAITRHGLQDALLALWRDSGASVLFVTHDLDEAVYLADRVVLLSGSPARVVRDLAVDMPRPRARAGLGEAVAGLRAALAETFAEGAGI